MKYSVKVMRLSPSFQSLYPSNYFTEILYKPGRPYTCLLVEYCDYYICIPFRSNIMHSCAFLFQNTKRSRSHRSGLDYTKIVLVKDKKLLYTQDIVVDQDEYNEVMKNIDRIVREVLEYITIYRNHITKTKPIHPREFERKYRFSTLKYFHDVLKI